MGHVEKWKAKTKQCGRMRYVVVNRHYRSQGGSVKPLISWNHEALHKNYQKRHRQMLFPSSKCIKICLRPGPWSWLGELTALPIRWIWMPFCRYTCGVQCHVLLFGGPWPRGVWGKGRFGDLTPQPTRAIANCCCHLANRKAAILPIAKLLWWLLLL